MIPYDENQLLTEYLAALGLRKGDGEKDDWQPNQEQLLLLLVFMGRDIYHEYTDLTTIADVASMVWTTLDPEKHHTNLHDTELVTIYYLADLDWYVENSPIDSHLHTIKNDAVHVYHKYAHHYQPQLNSLDRVRRQPRY